MLAKMINVNIYVNNRNNMGAATLLMTMVAGLNLTVMLKDWE
jgi:hypothetical protein